MASVALRGVTKEFGGVKNRVTGVNELTLEISDGELMVLLGPSGCGKTTTLRLVAGLESPTRGEIEIGETRVNDVSPRDRNVAMVFQHFALYPHLNVRENLAFGLKMRRTPKSEIKSRVEEVAALLEIDGLLGRRPHELSSGQQQRVALGRAIVRRPRVYLFDEPLANLDPRLRSLMRVEMKRRHREWGMTALYVTHDQDEAMALGDRIAVMNEGQLQQVGAPQEVYEQPANRFVAGFVGEPAMNFISGATSRVGDRWRFTWEDGRVDLGAEWSRWSADRGNEDVILGIRPDALRIDSGSASGGTGWESEVSMVIPLGDRAEVHVRLRSGLSLVVVESGSTARRMGERVTLWPDVGRVHLFEAFGRGMSLRMGLGEVGSHAA